MQIVEIHFADMRDPLVAIVTIIVSVGTAGFVVGAVMRTRGERRWDRVMLGGALLIGAAFVVLLAYTWLASPQ